MSTTTQKLGLTKLDFTDPADITIMNANWDKIDETLGGLKNPEYVQYTLLASSWKGSTVPYTYTITGYNNKDIEVIEDVSMTVDQLAVIESAKIKSNPSNSSNVLYAFGTKPTVDVPVMLIVR